MTLPSYKKYLHWITSCSDADIRDEFRSLAGGRTTMEGASGLDPLWCQLVCYYFSGYRVAIPRYLQRLTARFDALEEFVAVAHAAIGMLSLSVAVWAGPPLACTTASSLSVLLWLNTRRAARASGVAVMASRWASRSYLALAAVRADPLRRKLLALTSYVIHDLGLLTVLLLYMSGCVWSLLAPHGQEHLLLIPFYCVAAWSLAILFRYSSEPACFLYLSSSGEFPDSRVLALREGAFPARLLTLVRHDKPRVRLALRSSYVRISPNFWARAMWKLAVRLHISACNTVLLDLGEADTAELHYEVAEVISQHKKHITIGRADNPNGEALTWTTVLAFLQEQSRTWVGSIHGSPY